MRGFRDVRRLAHRRHSTAPACALALAIFIVIAVGGTTALHAQETDQAKPSDELPPTERLVWRPSAALTTLGYDSNVLNEAGDGQGDFVARFGAGVRPIWRVGDAVLSGETHLAYNYFRTIESERGADASARARADFPISSSTLHVAGSYLNAKERFSPEVDRRARRSEYGGEAGLDVAVSGVTTLIFAVRERVLEFEEESTATAELDSRLGRRERAVTTALQYVVTPLTTFVASGSFGTHRFPDSPDRDGERTTVEAGLRTSTDALVAGFGSIGWRRFTVQDPQVPELSGLAAAMNLSTLLGSTTRVGVRGRRDVTFSFGERVPFFLENSLGGSVSQALGDQVSVGASAERVWLDYVESLAGVGASSYQERLDVLSGSVTYRMRAGLQVSLYVESTRRWARDSPSRAYHSTRVYTAIGPVVKF